MTFVSRFYCKKQQGRCRVRLCGIEKELVGPLMYLHEVGRIIRKTGTDQIVQRREMDPERTQLFPPVLPVVSEHGFDVVLINRWIDLTDEA